MELFSIRIQRTFQLVSTLHVSSAHKAKIPNPLDTLDNS